VPLTEHTKGMLNGNRFALMKKGVRLLNFARGGLINNEDLIKAIENGIVAIYITDFPDEDLLKQERVIAFPHIGASTPEAENNCAIMATKQVSAFLEYGNVINSINFPNCEMPPSQNDRIIIANRNIPNMVGQITTILAGEMINIAEMLNKHKDGLAYNIIDVDENVPPQTIRKLQEIEGVIMVRVLKT